MSGAITYEGGTSLDGDELKIRDRYALTCNLLDSSLIEQGDWDFQNPTIRVRWQGKAKENTTYTASVQSGCVISGVVYLNSSGNMITFENSGQTSFTFTTPTGTVQIVIVYKKSDESAISVSDVVNPMLEYGRYASSFVPYTMDGVEVASELRYEKKNISVSNATSSSNYGGTYLVKQGKMRHLHIAITNLSSANTQVIIGSVPGDSIPTMFAVSCGWSLQTSPSIAYGIVRADINYRGEIEVYAPYTDINIIDMTYYVG